MHKPLCCIATKDATTKPCVQGWKAQISLCLCYLMIFQSSLKLLVGHLPEALELNLQKLAPGTHSRLFRSDSQSHGQRRSMKMEEQCEKWDRWVEWVIKGMAGGEINGREKYFLWSLKTKSHTKRLLGNKMMTVFFILLFLWMSLKEKRMLACCMDDITPKFTLSIC